MGEIEPLAAVADYESMYGAASGQDAERLPGLLRRASGYLLAYLPGYAAGADPVLDLNAATVCCAMAHRVLSAPGGMEGVRQFQQTAGSYSASVSMLDQYMRPLPSELDLLGAGQGSAVVSARMVTRNAADQG